MPTDYNCHGLWVYYVQYRTTYDDGFYYYTCLIVAARFMYCCRMVGHQLSSTE